MKNKFGARIAAFSLLLLITAALLPNPLAVHAQSGDSRSPSIGPNGITFPLQNPPGGLTSQASVTNTGQPGQRHFWYWVVVQSQFGAAAPSGPYQLNNAANLYGGGNGAYISWSPVAGATSYDVLRTPQNVTPYAACNCAVATGLHVTSTTDSSDSLLSYTVNTADVDGAKVRTSNLVTGHGTHQLECLNKDGSLNTTGPFCGGGGAGNGTLPGTPQYAVQFNNPIGTFAGNAGLLYNPAPGAFSPDLHLSTEDPSGQDYPLTVNSNGAPVFLLSFDSDGLNGGAKGIDATGVEEFDTLNSGANSLAGSYAVFLAGSHVTGDIATGLSSFVVNQSTGGTASAVHGSYVEVNDASAGGAGEVVASVVELDNTGTQDPGNAIAEEISYAGNGIAGGENAALYIPDPTASGDTAAYAIDMRGGKFMFDSNTTVTSPDDCPSCFIVLASDQIQGGGDIQLNAYGTTLNSGAPGGGGSVNILAQSPDQATEIESGGPGTVVIEALSDIGTDGLGQATMMIATGPYDTLDPTGGNVANLLIGACDAGPTGDVGSVSCNVTILAYGGTSGTTGNGSGSGNVEIDASSNGYTNAGRVDINTTGFGVGSPIDATEDSINLSADGGFAEITMLALNAYLNGNPLAVNVFSGSIDLTTAIVHTYSCNTVTQAAAGALITDNVAAASVGSLKAVSGYAPNALGSLDVNAYIDSGGGQVDVDVCNRTAADITPADAHLQVGVYRP